MRILVALDDSKASLHAAREAVKLFRALKPEFLVVNVAARTMGWAFPTDFGAVSPMPDIAWDSDGSARDAATRAQATRAGLPEAEVIADAGDPAERICAAAEEHNVDVVVVGSHDRGVLARLLEPSVSAAVVRGTAKPVLVVSGED